MTKRMERESHMLVGPVLNLKGCYSQWNLILAHTRFPTKTRTFRTGIFTPRSYYKIFKNSHKLRILIRVIFYLLGFLSKVVK